MDEKFIQLYKERCRTGNDCKPVYVIKTYSNGGKHCCTQCETCGDTHGNPVSKKSLDPSIQLKDFDEKLYQSFIDGLYAESYKSTAIQKQLFTIAKEIKKNYFINILEITETEFALAYQEYLLSEHWQVKRKKILERDNHTCLYCKERKAVQVHHLSYRNLGNESDFELMSVCYECHQLIHEEPSEQTDNAANYLTTQKVLFKKERYENNQQNQEERPRRY